MDIPVWWNNKFWQNIDKGSNNSKRRSDNDVSMIDVRNTRKLLENRPSTPSERTQIGISKNNVNTTISYPFKCGNESQRMKSADWGKTYANFEGKSCMIPLTGRCCNPKLRPNSSNSNKNQNSNKNKSFGSLRVSYTSRPVSATFRPDFNVSFQSTMMILGQNPFHQKNQMRSSTENLSNLKKKSLSFSKNSLESIYTAPNSEKSINIESDRSANRPRSNVNNNNSNTKRIRSASVTTASKKPPSGMNEPLTDSIVKSSIIYSREQKESTIQSDIRQSKDSEKQKNRESGPSSKSSSSGAEKPDSHLPIGAEFNNVCVPSVVETCTNQIENVAPRTDSHSTLERKKDEVQLAESKKPQIAWETDSSKKDNSLSISDVSNLEKQQEAIKNLHGNINFKLNGLDKSLKQETKQIQNRNSFMETCPNEATKDQTAAKEKVEVVDSESNESCSPRDKATDDESAEVEVLTNKDSIIERYEESRCLRIDNNAEAIEEKPVLFVPKSVILKTNAKSNSAKLRKDIQNLVRLDNEEEKEKEAHDSNAGTPTSNQYTPIKSILKRNMASETQSFLSRSNSTKTGRLTDSVWKEIFKVEGYTVDLGTTETSKDDMETKRSSGFSRSSRPYTASIMKKTNNNSNVPIRTSLTSSTTSLSEKRQGVRFDMRSNSVMEFHPMDAVKSNVKY